MRQDLRVRRTRKMLWEALLALLNETPDFEAISVQEICDRAMVHRTTFYQHYEDKYDLLRQGAAMQIEELLGARPSPLAAIQDYTLRESAALLMPILEHIAAHKWLYRAILIKDRSGASRLLLDAVAEQTRVRLQALADGRHEFTVPLPVVARFSAHAILGLLAWWLENDLWETPEEMSRHIILLVTRGSYGAFR